MPTYKIVKYYQDANKKARVIRTGLTLEEAQAHCRRPDTHNIAEGWYDGYTVE
jgi:hypothetical protein